MAKIATLESATICHIKCLTISPPKFVAPPRINRPIRVLGNEKSRPPMQDTNGLLQKFKHHHTLPLTVNEHCKVDVPEDLLEIFLKPHKLGYYYFVFMDEGTATYHADQQDIVLADSQMVCGFPNQVFYNSPKDQNNRYNNFGFDENLLSFLPQSYPFLHNPLHSNLVTFDPASKQRVKVIFSFLFQLVHAPGKYQNTAIILAYLNILLLEFNSAYFQQDTRKITSGSKLSIYTAFKILIETHLTEQQDLQTIAENLSVSTSKLYGIVKEFSGVSPKEWITNRLMQEAQRKLHYSHVSAKELAYELGFSDPGYFSRLFKKNTGKTVSAFLTDIRDLSHS
jgi:AraC family transcriptional regulator, transcriptional activator of pobA